MIFVFYGWKPAGLALLAGLLWTLADDAQDRSGDSDQRRENS